VVLVATLVVACKSKPEPQMRSAPGSGSGSAAAPAQPAKRDGLARPDFNRWAVRLNLPIYWALDKNGDKAVDADEVTSLMFYPTASIALDTAYAQILAASKAPAPTDKRLQLLGEDLDAGRATLVWNDLSTAPPEQKEFVGHMLAVAKQVDELYAIMNGSAALASQVPAEPTSQSAFRRNRGPKCIGPNTEKDPQCSAIPGAPKPMFDIYPAELQADPKFCEALQQHEDHGQLLAPFTVVRGTKDALTAVPITLAYKERMTAISKELTAAADALKATSEKPLVDYLRAAATGFVTNDWVPADEAWAKMTVDNSSWYVRVGPDEVYWEPCSSKGGMHLTFARINQGSKQWQGKLVPVQQDMEAAIAERAGAPYAARKVTFHLPDFIDIVVNAGDDRTPLGATIGQSLPNWGPVANEGRGRTVAMVNLYGDPDSRAARRAQAESVFDAESMKTYTGAQEPGLLSTILHEATHNLGPAHEYQVKGKKAGDVFGGPMASVMEELKAQTGALFLLEFLRQKKVISDELAVQSMTDSLVWAFGHISQGMYTGTGERKTYSNLAAIQIGILIEKGALTWDDKTVAANGTDHGAFTIHPDKLVPAVQDMMKLVAGIKARGDKAAADLLSKTYVESDKVVPHKVIAERFLRFPKASFVYAVKL
jgi:hypothetical protein